MDTQTISAQKDILNQKLTEAIPLLSADQTQWLIQILDELIDTGSEAYTNEELESYKQDIRTSLQQIEQGKTRSLEAAKQVIYGAR